MKKGEDYTGISVVFLCRDGEGNYLLQKRGKNCRDEIGNWDCGGGAIEFDETVENTLKNEIAEEFDTKVLDFEFLGFRNVHRVHNGKKTHWVTLDFKVLVDKSKVKNNEPNKFEEIAWFRLDNFPKPLHSQLPKFLEKYKGKL
ncbi:MAG: NUDIX domain-containing protein [Patescibacteria group bacterium]